MKMLSSSAVYLTCLALCGCLFSNDPNRQSGPDTEGLPYSLIGNRIVHPAHADTFITCEQDTVLHRDIFMSHADTLEFRIDSGFLTLDQPIFMSESTWVVKWTTRYRRVGPGSGIEGIWADAAPGYRIISGTLTAEEHAYVKSVVDNDGRFVTHGKDTLRFSPTRYRETLDLDVAGLFLDEWNGAYSGTSPENADSARYDIEVKIVDRKVVDMIGRRSREVVRMVGDDQGNRTYTSNNPDHPMRRFRVDPESCPNYYWPDWIVEFESFNSKVGFFEAISLEFSLKKGFADRFPFVPLKTMQSLLN